MKKTRNSLALLLLSTLTVNAQDTYWPLAGNYLYNTSTHAVTYTTEDPSTFFFDGDNDVVFNGAGELLVTGGPNSYFALTNMGQILPIANSCNKFLSLTDVYVAVPHGNYLSVSLVDASAVTNDPSTTGLPTVTSTTGLYSGANALYYGAAAAKMNQDGSRYIYYINPDVSSTTPLYRYTADQNGTVSTTPATIATGLPVGTSPKMSQDGNTIAYIDQYGDLVTYNISTATTTTYSTFNVPYGVTPGIEEVKVGTSNRWYLSNNTVMGYVNEGSASSWTALSTTYGINSSLALGKDGNIYFAYNSGGVSAGNGQLYFFPPATTTAANFNTNKVAVSGASIDVVVNNTYSFGNHVPGEDINKAGTPATPPSFTVAGVSQVTTPPTIYQCPSTSGLTLATNISSYYTSYSYIIQEGTYSGGVFTPSGIANIPVSYPSSSPSLVANLFSLLPALNGYNGYFKVTVMIAGPCGQSSMSQIFQLQQVTGSVDFSMVGPYTCTSFQSRNTSPSFTSFAQPVSTPPCYIGWLGAASCGITGTTASVTGGYSGYTVSIDKYDATGTTLIANVLNTTVPGTIPANFGFNALSSGYFITNYNTIKNNNAFKVTVSINSAYCGAISNYSWFKIIDGAAGGNYWKTPGVSNATASNQEFSVYPNPANTDISFSWYSNGNGIAKLQVIDMYGKIVYRADVDERSGNNMQSIDIKAFSPGMYMYSFSSSDGLKTGKFQKL